MYVYNCDSQNIFKFDFVDIVQNTSVLTFKRLYNNSAKLKYLYTDIYVMSYKPKKIIELNVY